MGSAKLMAQPANDHISDAIDLGEGPFPYSEMGVNFQDATFSGDSTPNPCGIGTAGIWYKFRATANGIVAAVMVNPDSSIVIFFEGPDDAASGQELTWVDQQSNPCDNGASASIQTTPGTTYYIYMRNLSASDVLINAEPAFQAPENDLIENAIDLAQEPMPYSQADIHILMATDTDDSGQIGCPSETTPGIWYKITPAQDGEIFALISGTLGTTAGIFYSSENSNATSGEELTWIDQPNNPCGPNGEVQIQAEEGLTYYLFVASMNPYINLQIDVSSVLNTSENNLVNFNYYPNPVIDQLNFNSKNTIDKITIYNLMGQQVLNHNINSNTGSIDLSNLSKGMYLAEITSGSSMTTAKILKK